MILGELDNDIMIILIQYLNSDLIISFVDFI